MCCPSVGSAVQWGLCRAGFTWDGMLHKMSRKQWDAMLAVHCTAPFRLIQAAAPVMRDAAKRELDERGEAAQRCIINVSSTSGTHGNAGQANYSTVPVLGFLRSVDCPPPAVAVVMACKEFCQAIVR